MKTLVDHINEALKIGKNLSGWMTYTCKPKTKDELKEIIDDRITKEGNECDLNNIDTSLIDDMSFLFFNSDFNGDISEWDVSNVKEMWCMFSGSEFNGDISNWNVSNVEDMSGVFERSKFNKDISNWNVANVENMSDMFSYSNFNQDISNWKINEKCSTLWMFDKCPIKEEFKPELPR